MLEVIMRYHRNIKQPDPTRAAPSAGPLGGRRIGQAASELNANEMWGGEAVEGAADNAGPELRR
jgi:hypothetical protein